MSSLIKASSLLQKLYTPLLRNNTAALSASQSLLRTHVSPDSSCNIMCMTKTLPATRTLSTSAHSLESWRDINSNFKQYGRQSGRQNDNFRGGRYRSVNDEKWNDYDDDYPKVSMQKNGHSRFEGFGRSFNPEDVVCLKDKGLKFSEQMDVHETREKKLFGKEEGGNYGSGINFEKYDDIPVSATGQNVPPSINEYSDLPLGKIVEDNIALCGYKQPTPCQKYSIPILKNDLDMITCSQTGSGKTAAFLLPIISNIAEKGPWDNSYASAPHMKIRKAYPYALILAPTRELVSQIFNEAQKLTYRSSIRCTQVYGGAGANPQIDSLLQGGNIVVATPGRLIDLIARGVVGLESIRYLVLDEADRMLDMGFEPQIRQIVEKNGMPKKADRITSMFSATFAKDVQKVARDFLRPGYAFLTVGRVGSTSENITQTVLECHTMREKNRILVDTLMGVGQDEKVLVFTNQKRQADQLTRDLNHRGMKAVSIHGDHTQKLRESSLRDFKKGHSNILIATDVASRGLDIPNVKMVINFDMPNDGIDSYVHRIGRTGRAGHQGEAIALFNPDSDGHIAKDLVNLLKEAGQEEVDFLDQFVAENRGRRFQKFTRGGNRGFDGGMNRGYEGRRDDFFNQFDGQNDRYSQQPGRDGGFRQPSRGGFDNQFSSRGRYDQQDFDEGDDGQQYGRNNRYNTRDDGFRSRIPTDQGFRSARRGEHANQFSRGAGFEEQDDKIFQRQERWQQEWSDHSKSNRNQFDRQNNDEFNSRQPQQQQKWDSKMGQYEDGDASDDDIIFGQNHQAKHVAGDDEDTLKEFNVDEENYKKFIKNRIK